MDRLEKNKPRIDKKSINKKMQSISKELLFSISENLESNIYIKTFNFKL